jgi:hypothetical protein
VSSEPEYDEVDRIMHDLPVELSDESGAMFSGLTLMSGGQTMQRDQAIASLDARTTTHLLPLKADIATCTPGACENGTRVTQDG